MNIEQRTWLTGFRQRIMNVLLELNSSNFGVALNYLQDVIREQDEIVRHMHELIKDYDNFLRMLAELEHKAESERKKPPKLIRQKKKHK